MNRDSGSMVRKVSSLIGQVLTRPGWLMVLFLLLACMLPFAGGARPFRGNAPDIINTFGFSLLSPSRDDFGPRSLLAVAGLFFIPSLLIFFRRDQSVRESDGAWEIYSGLAVPISTLVIYLTLIILSIPIIIRSPAMPGPLALGITILDLIFIGITLTWAVDFSIIMTSDEYLRPLVGWITAGALFLTLGMTDTFIINMEAQEIIEADWSRVTWHGILAVAAFTLYALPFKPLRKPVS